MNLTSFIAVPLVIAVQGFTLIVTQKNGEQVKIPVEDVTDITFEEIKDDPIPGNALQTPNPKVLKDNYSDFIVQWSPVSNAKSMEWTLDGSEPAGTDGTQVTFNNLPEGKHIFTLQAIAGSEEWSNSEIVTVELDSEFRLIGTVDQVSTNSISVKFVSNSDKGYTVGIVPGDVAGDANKHAEYVNANAEACQRKAVAAAKETIVTFNNLEGGKSYCVVGFRDDETHSFEVAASTTMELRPGDKGTTFAPGVSATAGFVDVDKVGDTTTLGLDDSADQIGQGGGDSNMQWACTSAALCQWWLDSYERATGEKYELMADVPSHGIYSTDIMEAMVLAYANTNFDALKSLKWFFSGVFGNTSVNGIMMLNEGYEYWEGGFVGLSPEELNQYINVSQEASDGYTSDLPFVFNRLYSLKGLTLDDAKKKFSRIMIETLREGPIGMSLPTNTVSVWGCDYAVDADGDPIVTHIYVGDSSQNGSNVRNGLDHCELTYKGSRDVYFSLPSAHDGGSTATTLIQNYFGIKGYKSK